MVEFHLNLFVEQTSQSAVDKKPKFNFKLVLKAGKFPDARQIARLITFSVYSDKWQRLLE